MHLCSNDLNCPPSTSSHTSLHYYDNKLTYLNIKCFCIDCYEIDSIFYITDKLVDNLSVEYNLNDGTPNLNNDVSKSVNKQLIDKVALNCINSKTLKRRRLIWNFIDNATLLDSKLQKESENHIVDIKTLNWHSFFCFHCQFRIDFIEDNKNINEIFRQFFNHFLLIHKFCLKTKLDYFNFSLIKNIKNLSLFVMADFSLKFGGVLFDEEESELKNNSPELNKSLLNIVKHQNFINNENDNKSLNESASSITLLNEAVENYANGLFNENNGLFLLKKKKFLLI